jgi:hypothetical protein
MRRILAIALCALMLSGCIAEWKSPRTGPRWKDGPGPASNQGTSGVDMGQGNHAMGPGPLNF